MPDVRWDLQYISGSAGSDHKSCFEIKNGVRRKTCCNGNQTELVDRGAHHRDGDGPLGHPPVRHHGPSMPGHKTTGQLQPSFTYTYNMDN
jgi:hypothetical protein